MASSQPAVVPNPLLRWITVTNGFNIESQGLPAATSQEWRIMELIKIDNGLNLLLFGARQVTRLLVRDLCRVTFQDSVYSC